MKRFYQTLIAFVAVAVLALPTLATAGAYLPGNVYIVDDTYMIADFNVRFNSSAGSNDAIGVSGGGGGGINIVAVKGSGNTATYWSCYVPTTSALFPMASSILNHATNGWRLSAFKSGSYCTNIYQETWSYRLN
ncbi:MAG: hypothetical protein HY201_04220 [Nitrospirae bacterium]|nr:hypothetical protein [Candidatus Troglogloeales bacterium]MBI3598637.1 hypothetical protein [Candidatus Troglogloeales bacterium]